MRSGCFTARNGCNGPLGERDGVQRVSRQSIGSRPSQAQQLNRQSEVEGCGCGFKRIGMQARGSSKKASADAPEARAAAPQPRLRLTSSQLVR